MSDEQAAIIDCGSLFTRVGLSGDEEPSAVFRTMVHNQTQVGDEVPETYDDVNISFPVQGGTIVNWDQIELVWKYCFSKDALEESSQDHPVLLAEAPLQSKYHREKMCQIMFEQLNVPGLYIASTAVLALYSVGRISGMVLDIGDRGCSIVPMQEGYHVHHAVETVPNFAGRDLTDYFTKLLMEKNDTVLAQYGTVAKREHVQDVKEQFAHVPSDYEQTMLALQKYQTKKKNKQQQSQSNQSQVAQMFTEKTFDLPDGKKLTVRPQDRFQCGEALFRPHEFLGLEHEGIHKLLFQSILRCDYDMRKEMFGNLVLSGGTTMLPGFTSRLQTEMEYLANAQQPVNIITPKERKHAVWLGGAVISNMASFSQLWVRKKDYNEHGPQIINRKCF